MGPGPERSKGYFLLLRRMLDMGMDPNQKASSSINAWQYALNEYSGFAHFFYSDYPPSCQREQQENRQLREMLKAVLNELLTHGADIHDFVPPNEEGLSETSVILRNMEEGRELLDGLYGLDPDSSAFKPYTMKYRGKEQLITPSRTVETYRQEYEIKWRELDPTLRAYYQ